VVQAAAIPPMNIFVAPNPVHDTITLIAPDGTKANLRAALLTLSGSVFFRSFLSEVLAPPDIPSLEFQGITIGQARPELGSRPEDTIHVVPLEAQG